MVKAETSIADFYPKMTHVTCIIHGLNRVCGKIRAEFDNVNELISNVKKVFIKAPNRIRLFRAICPDLTLPPEPVITRWGTWLTAAIYYADNYSDISAVIEALDGEEAVAIERTKKILTDCHLKRDLNLIKIHFGFLVETMTKLQAGQMEMEDSLNLLNEAEKKILAIKTPRLQPIVVKLREVLKKNSGLNKIKRISNAMDNGDEIDPYTCKEMMALKYAPLTSVDVERSFSMYKHFNRDNRQFTDENLAMNFMLYCNNNI